LKVNYIGVVAAVMALISLVLPWWTMAISATIGHETASGDLSIYLYQTRFSGIEVSEAVFLNMWFGTAALILLVIGGIAGIVGSLIIGKKGKILLAVTGILSLLSIIIFVVGLQNELSTNPPLPVDQLVGLFSSGSFTFMEESLQYFTYLSLGFWLALVAAILAFVSMLKHSKLESEK
jgi:hypothetical protein